MVTRIKDLINELGVSVRTFAISCGIRQNTLNNQLNGVRELSLSTVQSILNKYPEVSAEWLMRGEGEMILSPQEDPNIERVLKLVDTINTLQDALNTKTETVNLLQERIKQLENQLKK